MARSVSIACLLAGATGARADQASAVLSPGLSSSRVTRTDATGRTTEQEATDLVQQYTLSLDETLYPNLAFSGTGVLANDVSWLRLGGGPSTRSEQTVGTLATRLSFGTGLFGGALSYDRRQELAPGASGSAWATGDTYAVNAGWHPLELPTLDLRLTRSDAHDPTQQGGDAVAYDALFAVGYTAVRDLDLRFTLRLDDVSRGPTDTTTINQEARASWRTTLLGGRTNAFVSGGISSLWSQTVTSDPSGVVPTQRFAVAGLSAVEDFPALPENVTLNPTPGLVNGDLRTAAAGYLNLGPSVGATDRRPRDLGAQLPDVVTTVNRIQVWVDRALPAAVAGAFTWDAWRSDDGQHWSSVPLRGPVTFGTLENRFDIPIAETAARYLKVVTHAIDATVTTDARWSDVWVTELQLFEDVPAAELREPMRRATETFNASAQTRLLRSPDLTHDLTLSVTRPSSGAPTTWMVGNGLSLVHRATPTLTLSGRVAAQETDAGTGAVLSFQWTGGATHQPVPTLVEGITYTGQTTTKQGRTAVSNSLSSYARAELYKGVGATANATYAVATSDRGVTSGTAAATVGTSIVPNHIVSLGATYGASTTHAFGGGSIDAITTRQRLDASATFTPVPALFASAGATRTFGDAGASTLAHFGLVLSPFPDGGLLLRVNVSDSLDTAAASTSQMLTPSLRWTVRTGVFLDASYTAIRTRAPIEASDTRTAAVNLTITL